MFKLASDIKKIKALSLRLAIRFRSLGRRGTVLHEERIGRIAERVHEVENDPDADQDREHELHRDVAWLVAQG